MSLAAVAACTPEVTVFGRTSDGGGGSGATTTGDGGDVTTTTTTGQGGATTTTTTVTCGGVPDEDSDGDGVTPAQGDCNDCDPAVSPHSFDDPGNGLDDDCNGSIDDPAPPCDVGLALAADDPKAAARAVELCKDVVQPGDWGLVSAKWVQADGQPPPADPTQAAAFHLGHGMLGMLGPNVAPQAGQRMLGLSSGTARAPTDAGYQSPSGYGKNYTCSAPTGFPMPEPSCPGVSVGPPADAAGVELTLVVPANAKAFAIDVDLYAWDFPAFVCTTYDDTFAAIVAPAPAGFPNGNVAVQANGEPFTLNTAPFDVCACNAGPCSAGGKTYPCTKGAVGLIGTGFGKDNGGTDHGATGWYSVTAPVGPSSQITVRWAVYDGSDGIGDSTVLIDHARWIADPTVFGAVPVP